MARKYDVIDADGHILEPPDLWERPIEPRNVLAEGAKRYCNLS